MKFKTEEEIKNVLYFIAKQIVKEGEDNITITDYLQTIPIGTFKSHEGHDDFNVEDIF